jgi:hypothetical protein
MNVFKATLLIALLSFSSLGWAEEKKIIVPSVHEIRDYEPQPNSLMVVKYANDRVYLYRVETSNPKSECNHVKLDDRKRIIIITQATNQAFEYVLEPLPIFVSEWANYER